MRDRITNEEKRRMDMIFDAIFRERIRQEQLKDAGKFMFTCQDVRMGNIAKGLILGEECGEVCRAVLSLDGYTSDTSDKGTRDHLRKELIQVAAVAVAWVESLDIQREIETGEQHAKG